MLRTVEPLMFKPSALLPLTVIVKSLPILIVPVAFCQSELPLGFERIPSPASPVVVIVKRFPAEVTVAELVTFV